MMKAKLRCFSLAAAVTAGLLLSSIQSVSAFELLARRFGEDASQKCDACQKGGDACQKGACQKGACQKGACQKGGCDSNAYQKAPHQKLWGAHQKMSTPHQKLWGSHQKGAVQKGAVQKGGKGGVGSYDEGFETPPIPGAPVPAPIFSSRSA